MSRQDTIGSHKTTVESGIGKAIFVRYHNTVVWERSADGKTITLRTGGWKTNTTKLRMNQAFRQFGYNIVVSQSSGEWYVNDNSDNTSWTASIPFGGDTCFVDIA
jgi:hypothetical protein